MLEALPNRYHGSSGFVEQATELRKDRVWDQMGRELPSASGSTCCGIPENHPERRCSVFGFEACPWIVSITQPSHIMKPYVSVASQVKSAEQTPGLKHQRTTPRERNPTQQAKQNNFLLQRLKQTMILFLFEPASTLFKRINKWEETGIPT